VTNLFCVRAAYGTYTTQFVDDGYVAIDYSIDTDLASVTTREELTEIYRDAHPKEKSAIVIGQQVGQLARFLFDMKTGDYVITPAADTEWLRYGTLDADPSYYFAAGNDGCPFRHRRRVIWNEKPLRRGDLSVPFQNTIRSMLTVFAVSHRDEFFLAIGKPGHATPKPAAAYDPYGAVIEQVLELNDKEFEILVGHLLTALGFDGSEVTGKSGDGGVDATGELDVSNLAKVKVFVQAKRYKQGTKISASIVRQLRQAIPFGGQGAFITTADFQKNAHDVAVEANFPRIGLVNGRQLVDLLVEHWGALPAEFRDHLGLRPGLVRG
jgi:restriction system protein